MLEYILFINMMISFYFYLTDTEDRLIGMEMVMLSDTIESEVTQAEDENDPLEGVEPDSETGEVDAENSLDINSISMYSIFFSLYFII